jgi:aspartate racemase
MGPESGVALVNSIVRQTSAASDQQHLSTILASLPAYIPDRTLFLEGKEEQNPAFHVARIIRLLENSGASLIGIACNTCHVPPIFDVILDELRQVKSKAHLLHMPLETCKVISERYPHVKRVGVMSTNGSYKAGMYTQLLLQMGYEPVVPASSFQDAVIHRMIYDPIIGIKANAGKPTQQALQLADCAMRYFRKSKADVVILGCTELSLALNHGPDPDMILVDSTDALARALVHAARPFRVLD